MPLTDRAILASLTDEFRRYKALAEGAMAQVPEAQLGSAGPGHGNSIAILCWHVAGNFQSRFTDFLTDDGEKPWRQREEEFALRAVTREELLAKWETGWLAVLDTLATLTDADLMSSVTIRRQSLTVHEALHRSLAHVSYHVGQIVYVAHSVCGPTWNYLTIPPGGSAAYNANPIAEKPSQHATRLEATRQRHP